VTDSDEKIPVEATLVVKRGGETHTIGITDELYMCEILEDLRTAKDPAAHLANFIEEEMGKRPRRQSASEEDCREWPDGFMSGDRVTWCRPENHRTKALVVSWPRKEVPDGKVPVRINLGKPDEDSLEFADPKDLTQGGPAWP
jgi:hypothetical protein